MNTKTDPESPMNFDGLSIEGANSIGQYARQHSVAFLGRKAVSEMKKIIKESIANKVEIGFVGIIGDTKEIMLIQLPIDERNKINQVDVGGQINDKYSSDEQKAIFLEGHTHIRAFLSKSKFGGGSNLEQHMGMGVPTKPEDYTKVLNRGNQAGEKGAAPSLLLTPYGFTLYGSGRMSGLGYPSPNNSYLLYKTIKGE